jgi:hypothetical protein
VLVVVVLENPDRFAIRLTEQIGRRTSVSLHPHGIPMHRGRARRRGRGRVSRKVVAFLGATWTLSRLDLQPSKFGILQVPHFQRDPTGDHGEDDSKFRNLG